MRRSRQRFSSGLCATGLLALALLGSTASAQTVSVCVDPEPPPWTYWVRNSQGQRTDRIAGFTVDLLQRVFDRIGRPVQILGNLPWARCLKMVAAGEVDFVADAYLDDERARVYAYSMAYNTLTPQVWSRRDAPVSPRTRDDLRALRGCGMHGASYAHYGIDAAELDTGVSSYIKLIEKLRRGRCDYVLEELEVLAGFWQHHQDMLGKRADLTSMRPSWASGPTKHLLTRRGGPAASLIGEIDRELRLAIRDGTAGKLWRQHAGELAYQP